MICLNGRKITSNSGCGDFYDIQTQLNFVHVVQGGELDFLYTTTCICLLSTIVDDHGIRQHTFAADMGFRSGVVVSCVNGSLANHFITADLGTRRYGGSFAEGF